MFLNLLFKNDSWSLDTMTNFLPRCQLSFFYLPASSLSKYFASSLAPTSSLSISILFFLRSRFSSSNKRHFSSRRFLSQSTRWMADISLARRIWKKTKSSKLFHENKTYNKLRIETIVMMQSLYKNETSWLFDVKKV